MAGRHKTGVQVKGNKRPKGVFPRKNALKKKYDSRVSPVSSKHIKIVDLEGKMKRLFPARLLKLIRKIGKTADAEGINAFLVGGCVRDLIMGQKNYDLDLVVEGSAINFAKVLSEDIKGAPVVYERFGTAKIVMKRPEGMGPSLRSDNKLKIDIATARKERYARPGALPTVECSFLREDLYRRDFTINAMAVNINKKNFGLFVDLFGGLNDIENMIVRALHDKSFIDDPTRIFRAVRFEQRFGFSIEKHTEHLIQYAVKKNVFKLTGNQRIREEIILILKEKFPEKAVLRMRNLHGLRFIHPDLKLRRDIRILFQRMRGFLEWFEKNFSGKQQIPENWIMNFMLILDKLDGYQMDKVLKMFIFTRKDNSLLISYARQSKSIVRRLSVNKKLDPSRIYDMLEGVPAEILICSMSRTSSRIVHERIKTYLLEYKGVKTKVTGTDLKELGGVPGPGFSELMRHVLHAVLDKKISTKKEEEKYIKKLLLRNKRF